MLEYFFGENYRKYSCLPSFDASPHVFFVFVAPTCAVRRFLRSTACNIVVDARLTLSQERVSF
jgi:hypothetical protein